MTEAQRRALKRIKAEWISVAWVEFRGRIVVASGSRSPVVLAPDGTIEPVVEINDNVPPITFGAIQETAEPTAQEEHLMRFSTRREDTKYLGTIPPGSTIERIGNDVYVLHPRLPPKRITLDGLVDVEIDLSATSKEGGQ